MTTTNPWERLREAAYAALDELCNLTSGGDHLVYVNDLREALAALPHRDPDAISARGWSLPRSRSRRVTGASGLTSAADQHPERCASCGTAIQPPASWAGKTPMFRVTSPWR